MCGPVDPAQTKLVGEKVRSPPRAPDHRLQTRCGRFPHHPAAQLVLLDTPGIPNLIHLIGRRAAGQKCPRCHREVELGAVLVEWQVSRPGAATPSICPTPPAWLGLPVLVGAQQAGSRFDPPPPFPPWRTGYGRSGSEGSWTQREHQIDCSAKHRAGCLELVDALAARCPSPYLYPSDSSQAISPSRRCSPS